MSQPTITDLFGTGANVDSGNLIVNHDAFIAAGITDPSTATPLELLAAIIKIAAPWIEANTDTTVMSSASSYISAPATRNGLNKTQFNYTLAFYGSYTSPTFNPNEV